MRSLIVLPAYNEAKILEANVSKLLGFIKANLSGYEVKVIIADNNSKDNTPEVAAKLQAKFSEVDYLFVPQQGKGWAISTAWLKYLADYDFFVFMDADLATDLGALPLTIEALEQGYDLALGSRYLAQSEVKRELWRRLISYSYRLALKIILGTKVKDLPCGFKATTQSIVKNVVPQVQEKTWFWDSELVILAEKQGYKIKEVPVKWQEPRTGSDKSRVSFFKVSWLYLAKAWQLRSRKINPASRN